MISLQCCVSFCCPIMKVYIYIYIYIYIYLLALEFPFHLPHPSPLGHHRAPSWAPCVIQKLSTSCLTHGKICVCIYIYNATLSVHPTYFSPHNVHISVLYIYLSIPALQIGSLVSFSKFHIYVLIYYFCFSLSDLVHSVWQTLGSSKSDSILFLFMAE